MSHENVSYGNRIYRLGRGGDDGNAGQCLVNSGVMSVTVLCKGIYYAVLCVGGF